MIVKSIRHYKLLTRLESYFEKKTISFLSLLKIKDYKNKSLLTNKQIKIRIIFVNNKLIYSK